MGSGASKKAVVEEVKVVDPADLETKASDAIKAKRFDKALPMLQEALVQRQATEGAGTPAVASSMMQLAVVYDAVDQPTAAVSMYTRAASVLEAIYGTTPDMCPPLSAMGGMLMRRSQYEEALPHLVRVCHIWEESTSGDMCVEMLGPLAAMGACLFSLDRLEDAQAVREQAMAVAEATLEPESPRWLLVIAAYVQNMCRQGKYEEARPTLERGLAMAEATHGAMAPETVTWMVQAMRVYTHLKQYRPALMLARRAVDVCEGGHTKAARLRLGCALNNLAGLNELLGEYKTATEFRVRGVKILDALLAADHPVRVAAFDNLLKSLDVTLVPGQPRMLPLEETLMWQRLGLDRAARLHDRRRMQMEDRIELSAALSRVACSLTEQGRFPEALEKHMRALSLLYEVEAAAMIQAVIRGKQARKRSIVPEHLRLASVSKEPEPEPVVIRPPTPPKAPYIPRGLDISTAPVVIQAAWRGYLGRRRANRFRKRLAQRRLFEFKKGGGQPAAEQVASAVDSMMAEMLQKEEAAKKKQEADENAAERQAEAQARREKEWDRRTRCGLGQRRRQLALLTTHLAATHYVAGDIPAAAYAFGRVAALEANWRGSDNPRIQGTEARLQALFTEEAMRVTRTFRQVLAVVLDELDWFPSQRNLTMFWGISGNPSNPEVEMDRLNLPFARLRDEGDEQALAGTVALPSDKPTQQKRSRGAIEAEVEELQLAAGAFSGLLEEVVQDMAVEAARDVLEPLLEEFADDLAAAKDRTKKLTPESLEAARAKKERMKRDQKVDYQRMRLRLHRLYGTPIPAE